MEVLKLKSVPIVLDVNGTPAEGYKYTGATSTPESIQVCGKSSALQEFDEIEIPSSVLNVSGASDSIEKMIDITQYLPDNIRLVDESAGEIRINLKIEKEGTRAMDFLVSSIRLNNLAEDLQVSYETGAEITIRVSGDEPLLESLDITNAVSVDLAGYTMPGTYDLPVKVDLPDGISLEDEVRVSLTLEEKPIEDNQSNQSGQTEQEEESD